VLLGNRAARIVFALFILLPFVALAFFALLYTDAYFTYFVLLVAIPAALIGLTGKTPPELITALQLTSLTALLFAIGLGFGLVW